MNAKKELRILIVDDEPGIRRFIKASLVSHGYQVFEAEDGLTALERSVSTHPDAIILDLGLPDKDGVEVAREIRARSRTPIIILSVRDDAVDKIGALDAGADDYLTKPFSTGELLARLRAVMRRAAGDLPDKSSALKAGKLEMEIENHRVTLAKKPITLTPTEFDVLKILLLHQGQLLTHRQLLHEVWNKDEDFEGVAHLLRVTISNLRGKLEPDPDRPRYILTEPGIGYRLRTDP